MDLNKFTVFRIKGKPDGNEEMLIYDSENGNKGRNVYHILKFKFIWIGSEKILNLL